MKTLSKTLCMLFTISSLASGQEDGKKMTLQFIAFPKISNPEPVELMIKEEITLPVSTPGHELTKPYKVPALDVINIGKTVVGDDGEAVFQKYGSAKSVSSNQIILLLRKGSKNSDGFTLIPIDASSAGFGGASFLFINVSKLALGGVIGDTKIALKPGERKLIKPKPNHAQDICQVTLFYQTKVADKWKKFYDTRWPADKKVRSLIFFYQNPKTGRLGLAPIMDILPSPAKKKAEQ